MELRLLTLAILGALGGCFVNAAIDAWAWRPRRISPWLRRNSSTPPRTWLDRVPIYGWWRLRREASLHGKAFWLRPLLIEIFCAVGLATLYWFEVVQLGLIKPQLPVGVPLDVANLSSIAHAQFASHAILACLMLIASFIDIDEKLIPDEVTVLGTLLGLALVTFLPTSLLPQVVERNATPIVGTQLILQRGGGPLLGPNGGIAYIEPVQAAAPNEWPSILEGRSVPALAIGLGCFWLWCSALTRRIWRGRRGTLFALLLIAIRVVRDLRSMPLGIILIGGTLGILGVWVWGGGAWIGLLTGLIGLVISGGIVWIIRIVGTAAMNREAMGFGDVTLMMMIGTFLGWQACLITFFLAPFAAIVLGIVQLLSRRGDVLPYGPFLCLSAAGVTASWPAIWERTAPIFAMPLLLGIVLLVCFVLLGAMLYVWQLIKRAIFGVTYE